MRMEKSLRPGEEFLLGSLIYWGLWIAAVHREKTACVRLGPKGAGSSDSCTRPSVASLSSFVAFFNEENPRETMAGCGGSGYPVKTEGRMLLFFAKNSSVILNSLNPHICKKTQKMGKKDGFQLHRPCAHCLGHWGLSRGPWPCHGWPAEKIPGSKCQTPLSQTVALLAGTKPEEGMETCQEG